MKTLFKKVVESPEALAEFLSTKEKGGNKGCLDCANLQDCTGKETRMAAWLHALNSEA